MNVISAILLLFVLCGCGQKAQPLIRSGGGSAYTEEDVRKFVVPGTSRDAIIARFGDPGIDERNPKFEDGSTNIDEILYFRLPLPNPLRNEEWAFSGFQVRLHSGKAVDWAASHSTTHVGQ